MLWATIIAIPWITYNVFTWGGVLPPVLSKYGGVGGRLDLSRCVAWAI